MGFSAYTSGFRLNVELKTFYNNLDPFCECSAFIHTVSHCALSSAILPSDFITDHKLDIYVSQKPGSHRMIFYSETQQPFYICKPRSLFFVCKTNAALSTWSSFLCIDGCLHCTITVVLYRPPKASNIFITELSTLLTTLSAMSPNIILMGDFTVHFDFHLIISLFDRDNA